MRHAVELPTYIDQIFVIVRLRNNPKNILPSAMPMDTWNHLWACPSGICDPEILMEMILLFFFISSTCVEQRMINGIKKKTYVERMMQMKEAYYVYLSIHSNTL